MAVLAPQSRIRYPRRRVLAEQAGLGLAQQYHQLQQQADVYCSAGSTLVGLELALINLINHVNAISERPYLVHLASYRDLTGQHTLGNHQCYLAVAGAQHMANPDVA